ncbi:MAG: hypothetical protein AAF802_10230 [Planctomycetota bacterium]
MANQVSSNPETHEYEAQPESAPAQSQSSTISRAATRSRAAIWLLGSVAALGVFAAAYFAGQASSLREQASITPAGGFTLPPIDATAAVTSEKFSMATGFVSDRSEGLFVLDHNSGLLQCSVMYPRLGKFLGLFTINVHDALGSDKNAQYMMATGLADMPNSNSNPVGSSVVYVLNTSTGVYACYGIPFNRTMMNSNRIQQGSLVLLATGSADPVIDRDAIR